MEGALTRDEFDALEEILADISERSKRPQSLSHLLSKWQRTVVEIETGYDYTIYDYINDLDTRDLLGEISSRVPQSLRDRLRDELSPWDARFLAATRELSGPLVPGDESLPYWWFRVPKRPGSELDSDLRERGIG